MSGFIVKLRNLDGKAEWYTGRAGKGWLSSQRGEALVYMREADAVHRARAFQKRMYAFGTFMVHEADPADGHAAGAAAMSREACG